MVLRLYDKIVNFVQQFPFIHHTEGALVVVFFYYVHPYIAIMWFYGFLKYESQEYREIKDTCARDVRDFLMGLVLALIIVTIKNMFWG